MLLKGTNDTEFELALIEDGFPELQDDADDSHWATLAVRAGDADQFWEASAPCMNLFELDNLAEWFEALGNSRPEIGEIDLLEPGLKFAVADRRNDAITVRVGFHLDGRPDQVSLDAPADRDYLDITIDREQARAAAAELRHDVHMLEERHGATPQDEDTGILGRPDEDLGLVPPEIAGDLDESDDDRMF